MDAFFLPIGSGQRFAIYHPAEGGRTRGLVAYVHPFAEEMNKSRRMAALQARALAAQGYAVLQLDLLGCGDSSGDFGDATWQAWVNDTVQACHWLRLQNDAPLWLWGLRAGCLLAAQAAAQLHEACNFLFWAPTPAGKPLLQQFLRLKAAVDLTSGNAKAIMDGLRQQLAAGESVDIAGYTLSAALASGMEQATLAAPPAAGRLEWLDLATQSDARLSPASAKPLQAWQSAGF
ncbi:MAG: hydrolase 2, exosortase A system-associated, partial [Ferruginibacter sp.]|nr:hydrolase 2, exosortase A system-associated [Rhodoferax sp.]